MKKSGQKKHSIILLAIITTATLLYTLFVFLPTSRAIANMRANLATKSQFIEVALKDYENLDDLKKDLLETHQWVEDWQQISRRKDNLGPFFRQVAELSRLSGVRIERISPDAIREMKVIARHPVRLIVNGEFEELLAFLQALEQTPFAIWVDKLKLKAISEDSEKLTCELNLTVFTNNQGNSD